MRQIKLPSPPRLFRGPRASLEKEREAHRRGEKSASGIFSLKFETSRRLEVGCTLPQTWRPPRPFGGFPATQEMAFASPRGNFARRVGGDIKIGSDVSVSLAQKGRPEMRQTTLVPESGRPSAEPKAPGQSFRSSVSSRRPSQRGRTKFDGQVAQRGIASALGINFGSTPSEIYGEIKKGGRTLALETPQKLDSSSKTGGFTGVSCQPYKLLGGESERICWTCGVCERS